MIARIDIDRCDRSPHCPAARACPRGAIHVMEGGRYAGAWTVDESRCTGCGMCVRVCPGGAVRMHEE